MPRFAANLSMLYNEHEFLDRFAAAAADGFQAVEYLFPYAWSAPERKLKLAPLRNIATSTNGNVDAPRKSAALRATSAELTTSDQRRPIISANVPLGTSSRIGARWNTASPMPIFPRWASPASGPPSATPASP